MTLYIESHMESCGLIHSQVRDFPMVRGDIGFSDRARRPREVSQTALVVISGHQNALFDYPRSFPSLPAGSIAVGLAIASRDWSQWTNSEVERFPN